MPFHYIALDGPIGVGKTTVAERLGQRKAQNLLATGADAVFSSNVGCLIQIGRYLRQHKPDVWVGHVVDALWASYQGHAKS